MRKIKTPKEVFYSMMIVFVQVKWFIVYALAQLSLFILPLVVGAMTLIGLLQGHVSDFWLYASGVTGVIMFLNLIRVTFVRDAKWSFGITNTCIEKSYVEERSWLVKLMNERERLYNE